MEISEAVDSRVGFGALRSRNYFLYWSTNSFVQVGRWTQLVALPWLALELGATPLTLGLLVACQYAPELVFTPIAGVLADRVDRIKVIVVTQVGLLLQAGALLGLTLAGSVELWHVFALATIHGLITSIDQPTRHALLPDLVPRHQLMSALALNSTSFNVARMIGPALAGIIIPLSGLAMLFAVNVVTSLPMLLALFAFDRTKIRTVAQPHSHPPVLASLAEGIRYARRTPAIAWPLVLLGGAGLFGMNFNTLLPVYARTTLGVGPAEYGTMWSFYGAGTLIGVLAFTFLRAGSLRVIMVGGAAVFAAFELLLGLTNSSPIVLAALFGIGFSSMLLVNAIKAVVQMNVPDELRGRVTALHITVWSGTTPLGGILAGSIAESFDAAMAFVVGAILTAAVVVVVATRLAPTALAIRHPNAAITQPSRRWDDT
jgi:MFS family permease